MLPVYFACIYTFTKIVYILTLSKYSLCPSSSKKNHPNFKKFRLMTKRFYLLCYYFFTSLSFVFICETLNNRSNGKPTPSIVSFSLGNLAIILMLILTQITYFSNTFRPMAILLQQMTRKKVQELNTRLEDLTVQEKMMMKFTSFLKIGETLFSFKDSRENRLKAVKLTKGGQGVEDRCTVCYSEA